MKAGITNTSTEIWENLKAGDYQIILEYIKWLIFMSWPENEGILFFYISQTLQMNRISFMAFLLNAVF